MNIRDRRDVLQEVLCLQVLRCLLASDMQQCCYLEAPEHNHAVPTAGNHIQCDSVKFKQTFPHLASFPSVSSILTGEKPFTAYLGSIWKMQIISQTWLWIFYLKAHSAIWKYPHLQMFKGEPVLHLLTQPVSYNSAHRPKQQTQGKLPQEHRAVFIKLPQTYSSYFQHWFQLLWGFRQTT